LQSRLAENTFAKDGLVDYTSPVIRLASLSPEEFLVLLDRLRHVYASGKPEQYLVDSKALVAFMQHCHQRLGEAYFRTPRTTITAFINLLAVLEQNPGAKWTDLLGSIEIEKDQPPALLEAAPGAEPSDELTSFKL
jgi:hypothetical protein